jgi:uncharacterized protein involved in oxidation of intracellular sulfur
MDSLFTSASARHGNNTHTGTIAGTASQFPSQNTPQGYYNIERMLSSVLAKGGLVKLCGSCADARGLKGLPLIPGTELSTMSELTQWTVDADKVVTF